MISKMKWVGFGILLVQNLSIRGPNLYATTLPLVTDNGKYEALKLFDLELMVPNQLNQQLKFIAGTPQKQLYGTSMFAIEIMKQEDGVFVPDKIGADYMITSIRCNGEKEIENVKNLIDEIENSAGDYDGWLQQNNQHTIIFQYFDFTDGYITSLGAVNQLKGICYSVNINTYGVRQKNIDPTSVEEALDFIVSPAWESLSRL